MKKRISFKPIFTVLFLILAFNSSSYCAATDMKFTITTDKAEYNKDEWITVAFKLENNSKDPAWVNKRFYIGSEASPKDQREVYFIVTSPSGKKLECKRTYETGLPKSDYFVLLKPGEVADTGKEKKGIKGYFDFDEFGQYNIVGVYENSCGPEIGLDTFRQKITSPPISIKIIEPAQQASAAATGDTKK